MLSRHRFLCILFVTVFFSTIMFASNTPRQIKSAVPVNAFSKLTKTKENSLYLHNKIIVKLKENVSLGKGASAFGISALDKLFSAKSVTSVEKMFNESSSMNSFSESGLSKIYVAQYTSPIDAFEFASEVSKLPEVEYAEPWFIYAVDAGASCRMVDSLRASQWALDKINLDNACVETASTDTAVVGIIDTGVLWDHPDLAANIWINQGEYGGGKDTNQVDDDGNGKIDDWHGWDFGGTLYTNPIEDNNPRATSSNVAHGTHVAGIAAATSNNNKGVTGVGYSSKILPIKVASDNDIRGSGLTAYIVFGFQGLKYAADMHATVVNCSWGGSGYSQFEQEVISYVTNKGTLVVAAAGNGGAHEAQYPAAYKGVMSVAASGNGVGLKPSYSTYDETVDISAPGGTGGGGTSNDILSTYINNGYATLSGTSMAAPHVAGLVGLVKSKFPQMSSIQAGERVRVTTAGNPNQSSYNYFIGKGRINAANAVSDTINSPSVRIDTSWFDDSHGGNDNGIPDPGETLYVYCTFKNYLHATSPNAKVSLVSGNTSVLTIATSTPFMFGTIDSLQTVNNFSDPFKVVVGSTISTNVSASIRFNFADSVQSYTDYQWMTMVVNPLYASHRMSNVAFSVSNFGSLGYFDYAASTTTAYGDGFQYPIGDISSLFHATLMAATDSNHVIDNAYGNPINNTAVDWKLASDGKFSFPEEGGADQVIRCAFTDSGAGTAVGSSRIGLKVIQRSYAFVDAPDNDYVAIRYDIYNTRTDTLRNVYVGIYADWDVNDVNMNKVDYDTLRSLGYMWDSTGSNYFGVTILDTEATSFRAVYNPTYIYNNGFSEGSKYRFMTNGLELTKSDVVNDWSFVISAGPFTIPPGILHYKKVSVAFLGGNNLADLQLNTDAAKSKGAAILGVSERPSGVPDVYSLYQNYPNPFNPVTTISYSLAGRGHVSLKVYDMLGKEVASLIDTDQPAGNYETQFDGSQLSSGVYYYRLISDNFVQTKKLMLVK